MPRKYLLGIFLLSFSTLLFELSLTRVFSVTLWYHFGFLIISTALLGFGVSGVLLSLWKKLREDWPLDKTLGWLSVCQALSVIGSFWMLQQITFDPFSLYTDKMQLLYMPVTYIVVSIPFFFGGLGLALLFTRCAQDINRLYAFDLAGAALGCLAIIFTMSRLGGGGSVLCASVFAAAGAVIFFGRTNKWLALLSLGLLLLAGGASIQADQLIPLKVTANKGRSGSNKSDFSEWNIFSKVDLYIRKSSLAPDRKSVTFVIDRGTAATGLDFDLKPGVAATLREFPGDTFYSSCLAYLDKMSPSILVIGSGCGTQVLDALHHGAKSITAVDINPIINHVVLTNPYWSDLFHQPNVKLVTDEGRNFVRSTKEKYDAIVSVHTISNSAIASGALSLSENYVLTKEAFQDYFNHLTDSGIIYFTRPEFQLPRLFSTGREVLEDNGIRDVQKHFYAYVDSADRDKGRQSFTAYFIMSKSPLTATQVAAMNAFINLSKTDPPVMLFVPYSGRNNVYDSILETKDLAGLYRNYPFEVSPATDNLPFFNHHTRWSSLNWAAFRDIFSQNHMARMALEDKPVAEVSLLVLLVQVVIISAVFILLPLWQFGSKGLNFREVVPALAYFSCLGMGFIMVEIVLIQLFSLLLGEPVYTFAIVLGALLLFTGAGAYLSGKYALHATRTIQRSIGLLAVLLLAASFFLPGLLRTAIALELPARVALSVILILPVGILLGMPFPSGIRVINGQSPALIPWAWGVNGFFTVVGSVLALIFSMMFGFQVVLWMATGIYLLGMLVMGRRQVARA